MLCYCYIGVCTGRSANDVLTSNLRRQQTLSIPLLHLATIAIFKSAQVGVQMTNALGTNFCKLPTNLRPQRCNSWTYGHDTPHYALHCYSGGVFRKECKRSFQPGDYAWIMLMYACYMWTMMPSVRVQSTNAF